MYTYIFNDQIVPFQIMKSSLSLSEGTTKVKQMMQEAQADKTRMAESAERLQKEVRVIISTIYCLLM